jgi:exosortase/archaeosortase family protein
MQLLSTYKKRWLEIPPTIRRVIITGAIMLGAWKLLYTFWLGPERLLDHPLTQMVGKQTVSLMQWIWPQEAFSMDNRGRPHKGDPNAYIEHVFIYKNGKKTTSISDNCNGLEFMVLYAAFIIVMPGSAKRKALFIAGGIPTLHVANLARCVGLVALYHYWPNFFEFAHHYLFKIMVYAISFGLWVWYLKPLDDNKEKSADA